MWQKYYPLCILDKKYFKICFSFHLLLLCKDSVIILSQHHSFKVICLCNVCVCVCMCPFLLFWCQYFKTKLWNIFWKGSQFSPRHVTLVISFFHSFIESPYEMKGNSVNTPMLLTHATHLEKFLLWYIHSVTLNQFSPYLLKLNLVTRTLVINL